MSSYNQEFMEKALSLAKEAGDLGEVPVGAVIVRGGEIIATGKNGREINKNALSHAEIEAIDNACKTLGGWRLPGWRLPGCELYVTLEPCPMCAGAIINSRIEKVYFGAYDKKAGSVRSLVQLFDIPYNHKPEVQGGIMEEECAAVLSDFFKTLREKKKKTE